MDERRKVSGEVALFLALILASIGLTLMAKSDMGLSPASSISYVLNKIFPNLTFGTWNYIVQCSAIIVLVGLVRKLKGGYIVSFFLAILLGKIIDIVELFWVNLPMGMVYQVCYYAMGFLTTSLAISLIMRCSVPILPLDTFIKEVSVHFNIPIRKVRTTFDLACLLASIIVGITALGQLTGIGPGTVFGAFFTGATVGRLVSFWDKHIHFKPIWKYLDSLV